MTVPPLDSRGLPQGYPLRADLEVTPREVRELLKSGAIYLIDCRSAAEAATAKIAGAKLIPIESLVSHADQIETEAAGRPVVIHCHMGGRSLKAAMILRGKGINATSMAGGIEHWALDIDKTVPRY